MANHLYALLVGIDRYTAGKVPNLRGCVADVLGTYNLLTHKFAIPPAQILVLTAGLNGDEAAHELATRDNIIHAWRVHLGQAGPGSSWHGCIRTASDAALPTALLFKPESH